MEQNYKKSYHLSYIFNQLYSKYYINKWYTLYHHDLKSIRYYYDYNRLKFINKLRQKIFKKKRVTQLVTNFQKKNFKILKNIFKNRWYKEIFILKYKTNKYKVYKSLSIWFIVINNQIYTKQLQHQSTLAIIA